MNFIITDSSLTAKQKKFVEAYIGNGCNGRQAAISAGYSANTADQAASRMLRVPKIGSEIKRLMQLQEDASIANSKEVMKYFTSVMRGEILDQFGLEAPLSERTRAAQELARRTIDVENRINGKPDSVVQIVLDWNMEQEETSEDTDS